MKTWQLFETDPKRQSQESNLVRKEAKMSTKGIVRVIIAAVLFVAIAVAIPVLITKSAPDTTYNEAVTNERLAGSDWIERHPSNYYIGSDFYERHRPTPYPANYYDGSDYYERHPNDPYAGSDWIERHPSQPTP